MAGAAGAGFRHGFAAHIACLGRGFPQIVSRIQKLPTLRMTSEAECGIRPRDSQQLCTRLVLVDVMTSRARNDRLRIAAPGRGRG
jgi:hypothetical protein